MDLISGQQVAVTKAVPINKYPIDLIPLGNAILIAKLGETKEFKWRLVTDEQVDFNAISLKLDKFPGTNIDVSIAGTPIGLTHLIDVATIEGADLEKLAKQKKILVKVKNNETELSLNRIGCTLLDKGKEIAKIANLLVPDIQAALLPAAALGDVKLVKQAIADGFDINNVNNSQGGSALHLATESDHHEIVGILLNNGVDINAKDNDGNTALHVAAKLGRKSIVETLLTHGSDKSIMNKNNEIAADVAKDQETKDLINKWKN